MTARHTACLVVVAPFRKTVTSCKHIQFDVSLHAEAVTKWPPFYRRYFMIHYININGCIWSKRSLKFVTHDNVLVPVNQASTWIQQWLIYWRTYALFDFNELTVVCVIFCIFRSLVPNSYMVQNMLSLDVSRHSLQWTYTHQHGQRRLNGKIYVDLSSAIPIPCTFTRA